MTVTRNQGMVQGAPWLLFMFQLPARRPSQRVKIWRKLQKYGALSWKNAAYILPHTLANVEKFQWLAAEIRKHHGNASVVEVSRIEGRSDKQIIALFNDARSREYETLIREIRNALGPRAAQGGGRRSGALARFNRRLMEIASVDMFGCPTRKEAERLIKELASLSSSRPGGSVSAELKRVEDYRGRTWITRPRPEIDRVGSAWLIKRFLDPKARFAFARNPHAFPGAVRFDMFEGEFTHVGDDCTFETLLKRFSLRDKRLRLIAQIIHDADLEDNKFGRDEAKAIDSILKGWGKTNWPDAEILRKGFDLFEGLYLALTT